MTWKHAVAYTVLLASGIWIGYDQGAIFDSIKMSYDPPQMPSRMDINAQQLYQALETYHHLQPGYRDRYVDRIKEWN